MSLIHTSNTKPRIVPYNPLYQGGQIDRVQSFDGTLTLNRTKVKEVGREDIVSWKKRVPSLSATLKQYEYGTVDFYQFLANTSTLGDSGQTSISLNDFKTARFDVNLYETNDAGSFVGTGWYPKLRTGGFSLNIGDPEALIERNFNFVGEDEKILQNDNKYLIYGYKSVASGVSGTVTAVIGSGAYANYPAPAEDPDNSGEYMLQVRRLRSGEITDLTYGTDYTYNNGSTTLSVLNCQAFDEICFVYSASSYITGASLFTDNDADGSVITGDSVSIFLASGEYIYRLQSVSVDVSFERTDYKEIGNANVVQTGVKNKTVRVTLGRFLDTYTLEEVLRGVEGFDYGIINPRQYADTNTLIIKVYSDSDKSTFLMGYKFTNLAPTDTTISAPVDDYIQRNATLEGEEGIITADNSLL